MIIKEIKEKYPKSFELISSKKGWPKEDERWKYFYNFKIGISEEENCDWDDRFLFDFFDFNNLNIIITTEYYFNGINWLYQIFWHTPDLKDTNHIFQFDGTYQYGDNGDYDSRSKAEEAAFEKAFEKLEDKLK